MTLDDFLLARIAEDEAAAANWSRFEVRDGIPGSYAIRERVLAECEAKRRIATLMGYVLESWTNNHAGSGRVMWTDVNRRECHHAHTILENLALPYADHPDHRDEWRP